LGRDRRAQSGLGVASATTHTAADTTPPTAPTVLSASVGSASQIDLAWTASTDNVGVAGYQIDRCQGTGCTAFTQIATSSGASFSDTGLAASTTYRYQVRATDAAGNVSANSSSVTATTQAAPDTTPPTAPAGLGATAASATQINLSWAAATDNVGVTGYRVERCQGAGCGSFAQIATVTGTSVSDTGLLAMTSYSYRVRAADAAGNLSAYSNVASAATQGGQLYYIVPDHLNTPRYIADQSGNTVWKWDQAEPFGSTPPNDNPSGLGAFDFPLRFPGQYFDRETNLSYNYFRDYNPAVGRYVESDLIGLRGGPNTFLYAAGSPLILVDRLGLLKSAQEVLGVQIEVRDPITGEVHYEPYRIRQETADCFSNCITHPLVTAVPIHAALEVAGELLGFSTVWPAIGLGALDMLQLSRCMSNCRKLEYMCPKPES